MVDKTTRRSNREDAVKLFNKLAMQVSKPAIPIRAGGEDVRKLYEVLCSDLEDRRELTRARSLWVDNGGVELDESLLVVEDAEVEGENVGFLVANSLCLGIAAYTILWLLRASLFAYGRELSR